MKHVSSFLIVREVGCYAKGTDKEVILPSHGTTMYVLDCFIHLSSFELLVDTAGYYEKSPIIG